MSKSARYIHIESKLAKLNYVIPDRPPNPKGNYVPFVRTGNLVFLSGHLPQNSDGTLVIGRLGENLTLEEGQAAAKLVAINLIASMKTATGGHLDKVKRIVKLVGLVNSANTFTQQANVMNGCSDFLAEVFGEKGSHARSAIGTNVLPLGVPVEIEAVIELED